MIRVVGPVTTIVYAGRCPDCDHETRVPAHAVFGSHTNCERCLKYVIAFPYAVRWDGPDADGTYVPRLKRVYGP